MESSDEDFEPEEDESSSQVDQERTISQSPDRAKRTTPTSSSQALEPFSISSPATYNFPNQPVAISRSSEEKSPSSSPSQNSTPEFRIHPKILNNPFAVEPSYFARPNRYFGPTSTWRSWTEIDRAVSTSLEILRSQDLAIHLFNAYALRRKKADGGRRLDSKGKGKAENQSGHGMKEQGDPAAFAPPRPWTAWPLPPDQVPRDNLMQDIESGVSSGKTRDVRPSATLENWLVATATKFAKERWESREWEQEGEENVSGNKTKIKIRDVSMSDVYVSKATDEANDGSDSESTSSLSPEPPANTAPIEYFSSQAFATASSSTSESSMESENDSIGSFIDDSQHGQHQQPVFTADDDRIRELILPSVRHIISGLDNLLLAMHKSRQGYVSGRGPNSRSQSRSRGRDIDMNDDEIDPNHVQHTPQPSQEPPIRSLKRQRPGSSLSPTKSDPATPNSRSKSQARSPSQSKSIPRSRSAILQPHDWSSVLGMASITGCFQPETIARASERCARLFGENMLFRTFHENPPLKGGSLNDGNEGDRTVSPWFEESLAVISDPDEEEEETDEQEIPNIKPDNNKTVSEHPLHQPIRMSAACSRCYMHKYKCEAQTTNQTIQEPMNQPISTSCRACHRDQVHCSGITIEYQSASKNRQGLGCPHSSCPRNTVLFTKSSHLKRHITLAHGGEIVNTPVTPSRRPSTGQSPSGEQSNPSMFGNHTEFYCPVDGCSKGTGGKAFARSDKMYKHVRKVHPEVDVDMIKRLEARRRGDKRGRWTDERRRRSRSQNQSSRSRERLDDEDNDSEYILG